MSSNETSGVRESAAKLSEVLDGSANIVFFGGAGVSTESGVPDFRSESGLYSTSQVYGYPPEQLLSRSFFENNPELFFQYYKENLVHTGAKPNKGHIALARLEQEGSLKAVITQNVDGLHQAAGSSNVLELHGSGSRNQCVACGEEYGLGYILDAENCHVFVPKCGKCGATVRPCIVLYEEALDERVMRAASEAVSVADCLIVGGTSLAVYPAAGLLRNFRGRSLVLINKTPTPYDTSANLVIRTAIAEVLDLAVGGRLIKEIT